MIPITDLSAKVFWGEKARDRWRRQVGENSLPFNHIYDPVWEPFLESIADTKVKGEAPKQDDPEWWLQGQSPSPQSVPQHAQRSRGQRDRLMQALQGMGR